MKHLTDEEKRAVEDLLGCGCCSSYNAVVELGLIPETFHFDLDEPEIDAIEALIERVLERVKKETD